MAYRYSDYENEKKNGANTSSSNSSYRYSDWQKEKRTELAPSSRQQAFQPSATGATANTQRLSSPLDAMPAMVNSGSNLFSSAAAPVQQPTVAPNQTHAKSMLQQNLATSNSIQNKASQPMMVDPNNRQPLFDNFTPKVDSPYQRQRDKDQWVEDYVDSQASKTKGTPFEHIDNALRPLTKAIAWGQANIPGIAGFQKGAGNVNGVNAETAPTFNTLGDKIGTGIGMIAGGTVNFSNPSQGLISAPFKAGQGLAQSIASKSPALGNRFAQRAIEGGVAGGIQGGVISGVRGETDAAEMAKNIGLGVGLGAVGDVTIAGLGSAGKALRNQATNAAESVTQNQLNAIRSIDSAAQSTPVNGRMKVVNNDEILSRTMEELKPLVEQRMTPPLENKRELAKWLQPHVDDSLNNINGLSYDDLLDLANDVRARQTPYEVAQQVAKERGINLDGMLNNTNPSFMEAAERLRMGGVSGAIDVPQNARVAITGKVDELVSVTPTKAKEDLFSKLFGNNGVGIKAGGGSAKELIDTHVTNRAKASNSLWDDVQNGYDKVVQERIDQFEPFRKIGQDTYDKAMDTTRANNLANVTIKDNFVDLDGNVIGKGLKQVYDDVPSNGKDISDRYLILRDAVVDMENKKKVYPEEKWFPQTAQEAQQMVTELESRYPWLQKFGSEWNDFNANRLNMWADSGIASKGLTDHLLETRPNYVSKFRQQKSNSLRTMFKGGKSGFSNQKAPIQKSKGSTAKIVEPAQGMIDTTAASYQAMLRNRVMQDVYEKVSANPEKFKGVIEIPESTRELSEVRKNTMDELNKILNDDGLEGVADFLNNEAKFLMTKSTQDTVGKDNMVTVLIEGTPVKMQIHDPSVLRAIEGISPTQLEGVLGIIDVLSRGIKQSATGVLAPIQGAKLFLRDLPVALAQSKDKARFLGDFSHAMISQIADWLPKFVPGSEKTAQLARDYYNAGGGYEAYLKGDSRIRAAARDITPAPVFSKRGLGKLAKQANPLKPFKEFGDAMENIPRIAAFNASMRKNGWVKDESTVRKALEEAREATVNWSRKGAKGQEMEALFPYSNAAIQGTYRFAKRFKEQPVSAVALIATVAAAKIASYEKFKNDTDYQQRSKFEKGIVLNKRDDGKFVTVPIEATESFVADRILDLWKSVKGEETANAKEMVQSGAESFLPSYLSGPINTFTTEGKGIDASKGIGSTFSGTVFEPIQAITTGKNYFGGDIVPPEYQENSTANQYNSTSSVAGKWAAENLGIDAFTFDYLGKKFGGDIAKIALPASSDIGSADTQGNMMDEIYTRLKLLEDPIMKNDISNEYFNLKEKVTELNADYSDGKVKTLPSWYEDVYDKVTSNKKGSINKQVSELTTERKEVERDALLTSKQRADKVRDIQTQINLLRLQGIKIMEELGVKK